MMIECQLVITKNMAELQVVLFVNARVGQFVFAISATLLY